jgi:hypothetical protein
VIISQQLCIKWGVSGIEEFRSLEAETAEEKIEVENRQKFSLLGHLV